MTHLTRADFLAIAVASPLPLPSALPTGRPSLAIYFPKAGSPKDTPLEPDRLLHLKDVRVVIVTGPDEIAAANAAVDAARATTHEPEAPLDVRWGLRFSTATGRFVHSIYCDATAAAGQVDGRPVVFANGAALIAYLMKTTGSA